MHSLVFVIVPKIGPTLETEVSRLVLLKRVEQLNFEDHFEMIRLLGTAARQLAKKEHADSLIDAMRLSRSLIAAQGCSGLRAPVASSQLLRALSRLRRIVMFRQLSPACRVTVRRILGGLHHEYGLETVAA